MAGSSQYKYDEDGGQFLTFVLTFLLLVLIPVTYSLISSSTAAATGEKGAGTAKQRQGWFDARGQKVDAIKRLKRRSITNPQIGRKLLFVVLGWAAAAWLFKSVSNAASTSTDVRYDPFTILGISASATEKEIKKHYKKLSIKFHPDKLRLGPNQTKEEAESHYIDLTKAYKSLTDDTIRKNYELYGHPDGKQEMSMGIALPTWISESQNNIWVLGVYGLLFGIGLPYLVARWWYGSRSRTKDGIINGTAQVFFQNLREETPASDIPLILSLAEELTDPAANAKNKGFKPKEEQALKKLQDDITTKLKEIEPDFEFANFPTPSIRKTILLLFAHSLRIEIADASLDKERYVRASKVERLLQALLGISLAHNWMDMTQLLMTQIQCHVQAVPGWPSLRTEAELAQLPHISLAAARKIVRKSKWGPHGLQGFVHMEDAQRRKLLGVGTDIDDKEYDETMRVAGEWPRIEVSEAFFKVSGERLVTAGAIVQFVVKLRLLPPKRDNTILISGVRPGSDVSGMRGESSVRPSSEEDAEEEELGRKDSGSSAKARKDGKQVIGVARAPWFPEERKPTWWVTIVDPKQQKVIVQPTRVTDVGPDLVRSHVVQFQAPPQPGLYTFMALIRSDSYLGSDATVPIKLKVDDPSVLEGDIVEDDISDPEEDTLAGQMAVMRGERVKTARRGDDDDDEDDDDDDDDESGTDDGKAAEDDDDDEESDWD